MHEMRRGTPVADAGARRISSLASACPIALTQALVPMGLTATLQASLHKLARLHEARYV